MVVVDDEDLNFPLLSDLVNLGLPNPTCLIVIGWFQSGEGRSFTSPRPTAPKSPWHDCTDIPRHQSPDSWHLSLDSLQQFKYPTAVGFSLSSSPSSINDLLTLLFFRLNQPEEERVFPKRKRRRQAMSVLDSRFDASLFNDVSLSFLVNNLWPWVAVLAAAISFWRIRGIAGSSGSPTKPVPGAPNPVLAAHRDPTDEIGVCESPTKPHRPPPSHPSAADNSASASPEASTTNACGGEDGVTKGRFIIHYKDEEVQRENDDDDEGEREDDVCCGGSDGGVGVVRRWRRLGDRERISVMMGTGAEEMGWYKCQDLMVFDGGVVRLWQGQKFRRSYSW